VWVLFLQNRISTKVSKLNKVGPVRLFEDGVFNDSFDWDVTCSLAVLPSPKLTGDGIVDMHFSCKSGEAWFVSLVTDEDGAIVPRLHCAIDAIQ
jgi:hypothetical protein